MKKARRTLEAEYDAVVAGAGLGGLTAAALFSREGFSTLVIEKLPRIGGRLANIPYKGFQLTTGALHLIPHQRGVAKRLFKDKLNCDLEFIDTGPTRMMFEGSIVEVASELHAVFDSIFRFSLGLKIRETPICEAIKFLVKAIVAGKPCMPKGGCGSIIQALEKIIVDNKGEIAAKTSLSKIKIQNCKIASAKIERMNGSTSTIKTSLLISDIGPRNTLKALQDGNIKEVFQRQLDKIKPAEGIKITIESNRPVLNKIVGEEVGLIFTPSCKRVAGIVEPSSMDPDLAPHGKSLLMTHQEILCSNVQEEIQIGINDLKKIIPDLKKNCRVLAIQVFKGNWPVNHARQGQDTPQKTPINGLYLVGDGAKPSGLIMAEGVVESARRVVECILRA